ncbi:MAG TPA: hypothetical protein VHO68_03185 [Bacteroidales bacterium]|nr:hypothetical protein [Bacteroidales bacterium]
MASIIEGYNYDIFISYRQKDNKHDGWVTEFVNNLRDELESTFKEEISVYFDINPHDGLLETYDVDASLKEKLKCLIFIPIISRTYCDPKSFAWEHEFRAFVNLASDDNFGLLIKLHNGNVVSRVLPVKIHDIDEADTMLCQSLLGTHLRGIEFVYREAGVNRPLREKDKEEKNLNKTDYRNQVNKVANAIKDIISAVKQPATGVEEKAVKSVENNFSAGKKHRFSNVAGVGILLFLAIMSLLFLPKLFRSHDQQAKSIAVLPFRLLSDEPDKQYLADGMMEAINLHLSRIKDLNVMSITAVQQYKDTKKTPRQIGSELGVDYLLEGSFQKYDQNARLIVRLIKTRDERQTWSNEYVNRWNEVFSVQSNVAQSIANELNALITPEEKESIEKKPTTDLTAYDFYQKGQEEYSKYRNNPLDLKALDRANELFMKALEYDRSYSMAYSGLASIYFFKHYADQFYTSDFLDSCLVLLDDAISFDKRNAEAYYFKAEYYWQLGQIELVKQELDKALRYNPNYLEAYLKKAELYSISYKDIDYVKAYENLLKAISLNHGKDLPNLLRAVGGSLIAYPGFFESCERYYIEALKLDNDSAEYFFVLGQAYSTLGDAERAIEYLQKSFSISAPSAIRYFDLGTEYSMTGEYSKSLECLIKYSEWLKNSRGLTSGGYHRIGYAYYMTGDKVTAEYWFNEQRKYCEEAIADNRTHARVTLAAFYDLAAVEAFFGEKEEAYRNLEIFSQISVCPLWWLTLIKSDPLFESIRNEDEFRKIVADLEVKYNAEHERFGKWLKDNRMN